ncbi:MAG TPA: SDR family NAD(P)-dependent oxidoreductase, partial [Rhodanobacteraceae bacterium]
MAHKTAIITGAGGAIATHVSHAFAEAGWKLALVAFDAAERQHLEAAHPEACTVEANLADDADARRAIGQAIGQCGRIDALLNIAGGFDMSGAADTTPAQLEAQLDINLRTAFNATRAMLPHML